MWTNELFGVEKPIIALLHLDAPVSYTHLDVYKRQVLAFTILYITGELLLVYRRAPKSCRVK